MSKSNDCTTGNLLDYEYLKDHYQLIAIDLSKQIKLENFDLKQQNNFIGRLEENNECSLLLMTKIMDNMTEEMKMMQPLNLMQPMK